MSEKEQNIERADVGETEETTEEPASDDVEAHRLADGSRERVEDGEVSRVEPGRVEPGRVEPGRVEPGRVEPGRVIDS